MNELAGSGTSARSHPAFAIASWAFAGCTVVASLTLWLLSVTQALPAGGQASQSLRTAAIAAALSAVRHIVFFAGIWGAIWLLHRKLRTAPVILLWFFVILLLSQAGLSVFGFFYYISRTG